MRAWFLTLLCVFAAANARADIWSYTGEDGTVHFTNVRPRGKQWKKVLVSTPPKGNKAAAARGTCDRCDAVPARDRNPDRYQRYDELIHEAAALYHLPVPFLRAVIKVESDYDPSVVSSAGARGLMQVMPAVISDMRIYDPHDPRQNILAGARLLRVLANQFDGDITLTIAGYHAGAGAVRRYGYNVPPYPNTQKYVQLVLGRYEQYKRDAL